MTDDTTPTPPPGLTTVVRALVDLVGQLEQAAGDVDHGRGWDRDDLAVVWRDCKQLLYDLGDVTDGIRAVLVDGLPRSHRGWNTPGRPVVHTARWETEVLDVAAFEQWLATRPADTTKAAEVEWTAKLNADARAVVRRAVEEDGEKVPGISAGYSAPYLTLGRRPR